MDDKLIEVLALSENIKLLYVEDNEDARRETLELLSEIFDDISVAKNGLEGIEAFNDKGNIDLIITDVNMPKMNGIDMIKTIRESDSDVNILILSAYNESNYFVETIKIGIDGYLLKPLELEQFFEILTKVLEKISLKKRMKK